MNRRDKRKAAKARKRNVFSAKPFVIEQIFFDALSPEAQNSILFYGLSFV